MPSLNTLVKNTLLSAGVPPHRLPRRKPNIIDMYTIDAELCHEYDHLAKHTLVDRNRIAFLKQFAIAVRALAGDVAEVGVYKGGTAWLIAKNLEGTNKTLHIFDTFEGMPETHPEKDLHKKGDFADAPLDFVKRFLADRKNIMIYPGYFPDTAPPIENKEFCLVHIDVDIYQSVLDCCAFFYSRMVKCGLMVFDDYGFLSTPGAKEAVDKFFADRPETPIYLLTGQALVIKS